MALGSVDVSLYELTNAVRTIANGGEWSELKLQFGKKKTASRQVINREAAFIVSDILSDRSARSLTFGYESPLSTRFWTAVKTGTSKDMRDNWCIGFSDRYTVGVWVGNFSGAPMWNVSGISGAAPVWLEVMNYLHRNRASKPPSPPAGIVAKKVEFDQSAEPARDEWFMRGTEPSDISVAGPPLPGAPEKLSIAYPLNDTVIAIDPNIPAENSRIFFEATGKGQFDWVLNQEKIGAGQQHASWRPEYGRYVLSLVDKRGRTIDSVNFEVRGMPPQSPGQNPAAAIENDEGD